MVCDDFADHMTRRHKIHLFNEKDIRLYTRAVGAFCKLSYCHKCGWRHSSDMAMREHKLSHESRRTDEPKPLLPTPCPPSSPPEQKSEAICISDDEVKQEPADEGDEVAADKRKVEMRVPKAEFPVDSDDDAAWGHTDEVYDDPDGARHAGVPFAVCIQGDIIPARDGEPFKRRRVMMERIPHPGFYCLEDDAARILMRVDVVFHPQQPDKHLFAPRLSAWNELGMTQEATLLTARNRPATATRIVYFEALPQEGLYYLVLYGDSEYTTRVYVSDVAAYRPE